MKHYLKSKTILAGTVAILGASLFGILLYPTEHADAKSETAVSETVVQVKVQTIASQKVQVWSSFSGRTRAVDFAEIRPEVSGRITEVKFQDGDTVKAGQALFVIDPRPYEAAVAKAEANLASAQTNAQFTRKEMERAKQLVKTQTVPERIFDERNNNNRVAQANVKSADAELKQAKLDLEHAYVKAPIAGRVSRAEITVGNLVQTGPNAPLLTSIVSNDGIYADFEVDEQSYLQNIRTNGGSIQERKLPVELTLQGDKEHVYKGTIHSFDNHIDTASGTIRARAKFENIDGTLMPGMFVSVKLGSSNDGMAVTVPESAIGTDQDKKYVYVVGDDKKVAYREVTVGKQVEGKRIVLEGLKAGDKVIVEGQQQVKPDVIVDAKEVAVTSSAKSDQRIALK